MISRHIATLMMMVAALVPTAMASAAWGASVEESEWRASLRYDLVSGLVPPGRRRVMVVGAGADARKARAVASLLAEELDKARPDVEILPASRIGASDAVSDMELVTRAAALAPAPASLTDGDDDDGPGPRRRWLVDTVVVVRLYAPPANPPQGVPSVDTAVISTYDRGGERLGSLSVDRGRAIGGEDLDRLRASATPTAQDLGLLRALAARQIRFEHPRADNVGDAVPAIGGREGRLGGDEFYRTLGRLDLAKSYSARQAMRITLIVDGPALTVTSIVTLFTAVLGRLTVCTLRSPGGACTMTGPALKETPGVVASALLANVGATMFFVGLFYDPHPLSMEEASALVAQFNEGERRALGLPAGMQKVAPIRPRTSLLLVPDVGPSGGGLSLVGRF